MSKAEIISNDVEPSGRSQSFCIRRSALLTTSTCVKTLPRPLPADFLRAYSRRCFYWWTPHRRCHHSHLWCEVRLSGRTPGGSRLWQTDGRSRQRWWTWAWLWNDLWQPVSITGPHAPQHLICYLSQASFRNLWTNAVSLFVPKRSQIKNVGHLPWTQ